MKIKLNTIALFIVALATPLAAQSPTPAGWDRELVNGIEACTAAVLIGKDDKISVLFLANTIGHQERQKLLQRCKKIGLETRNAVLFLLSPSPGDEFGRWTLEFDGVNFNTSWEGGRNTDRYISQTDLLQIFFQKNQGVSIRFPPAAKKAQN